MTRRPEAYDGPGDAGGRRTSTTPTRWPRRSRASTSPTTSCTPSTTPTSSARTPRPPARSAGPRPTAGVRQIVYMGGLGDDDDDLSAHLRSRREVEGLLGEAGVPVTVLRAAIVVGHGGISWELTRQLVKNLPAMVVPKWVAHPDPADRRRRRDPLPRRRGRPRGGARPGLRDRRPRPADLPRDARRSPPRSSTGRRVPIVEVPVLTPRLSSYWLALVTDVDVTTGRNLIDSMGTEVLVTDHSIRDARAGRAAGLRRGRTPRARGGRPALSQRLGQKSAGSSEQHRRPTTCTWVRIGARMPPVARRSRPTTAPSSSAGEGEHHVAGGQGGDGVGDAW